MAKLSDYFKGREAAHDLVSGTYKWVHPDTGRTYYATSDSNGLVSVTVEVLDSIFSKDGYEFQGKVE